MKHERSEFINTVVELDGNEFIDCSFHKTKLIYRGGIPPTISGCKFFETPFVFEDSASNTLAFMAALYHGGFQSVIEGTIQNIRRNFSPVKDSQIVPYINKPG